MEIENIPDPLMTVEIRSEEILEALDMEVEDVVGVDQSLTLQIVQEDSITAIWEKKAAWNAWEKLDLTVGIPKRFIYELMGLWDSYFIMRQIMGECYV